VAAAAITATTVEEKGDRKTSNTNFQLFSLSLSTPAYRRTSADKH
jgi:hypothetical protein